MLYLIDAYNWLLSTCSEEIISEDLLKSWIDRQTKLLGNRQVPAILIFDAAANSQPLCRYSVNSIEIIFTPFEQTADELILEMIGSMSPFVTHVITSDRLLGKSCRSLGAKTSTIRTFARKLNDLPRALSPRLGDLSGRQLTPDEPGTSSAWINRAETAHFQHIFEMRYRQLHHLGDGE